MKILKLINDGSKQLKEKNIYSHKLDSEILLSEVLSQTREKMIINFNKKIPEKKIIDFNELNNRRYSKEQKTKILVKEKRE